jgi:hypothetical protein
MTSWHVVHAEFVTDDGELYTLYGVADENDKLMAEQIKTREDASLMASAPELQGALLELFSMTDKMEGVSEEAYRNARQKVRLAIAKSAGEK